MNAEELQVSAFGIILHSGTARSDIHEAFALMRSGDYEEAVEKLESANKELVEAHHSQTELLQHYASGVEIKIEIIMVHAQDHLMTTMTLLEIAKEMLELHRKIKL